MGPDRGRIEPTTYDFQRTYALQLKHWTTPAIADQNFGTYIRRLLW